MNAKSIIRTMVKSSLKLIGFPEKTSDPARQDSEPEQRSNISDHLDAEFFNRRKDDNVGGEG